jgi:hypothetical protein
MDDGPCTALGTFGWFLAVWVVMMVAISLQHRPVSAAALPGRGSIAHVAGDRFPMWTPGWSRYTRP